MTHVDPYFRKLTGNYLFSEISRQVAQFQAAYPEKRLIRLGIGDVTRPLPAAVVEAMTAAAAEQGTPAGFHGYGPEQGYPFLREAIALHDYQDRGIHVDPDEIFVSDGAKSDCGGIGDLFAAGNTVALCDPVYSVYLDTNVMAGRAGEFDPATGRWSGFLYLPCTAENGFVPAPPAEQADLIYLCFPANPTGASAGRAQLQAWVDYANDYNSVILFDGAYEAFVTTPGVPRSIFELPGARTCAIEFRSFSKTAGFTGTRCAYTVIPRELEREGVSLHRLWARRQATKTNGVCYVVQRGAQAVYTPAGRAQVAENLAYYRRNALTLRAGLTQTGLTVYGGVDSPYLWVKTPKDQTSQSFFRLLLEEAGVVTTPGSGFGPHGEGYIRLTSFGKAGETQEAAERIAALL